MSTICSVLRDNGARNILSFSEATFTWLSSYSAFVAGITEVLTVLTKKKKSTKRFIFYKLLRARSHASPRWAIVLISTEPSLIELKVSRGTLVRISFARLCHNEVPLPIRQINLKCKSGRRYGKNYWRRRYYEIRLRNFHVLSHASTSPRSSSYRSNTQIKNAFSRLSIFMLEASALNARICLYSHGTLFARSDISWPK